MASRTPAARLDSRAVAAIGGFVVAVVLVAVLMFARRATSTRSRPTFDNARPAREGQPGPGRRPADRHDQRRSSSPTTPRRASRSRSTRLRAAAPGHHRRRSARPRCRASRTATSRSPRARTTPTRSTTAARSTPTTRPRPSTSTSSSTRSTRRRARASSRSSRARRTQYDGKARGGERGREVLQPGHLDHLAGSSSELVRDQRRVRALHRRRPSTVVSALAERRDDLAALVGNANATARAIGDENAALAADARPAAADRCARPTRRS